MDSLIIKAEKFAKEYYDKCEDSFDLWRHVQLVRKYSLKLAELENADKFIVEMSAIFHDVGKIKGRERHHLVGKGITKKFLDTIDLLKEKKELILKCVLKHRSRFSGEDNEIEVKVVNSGDALGLLFDEIWQEKTRKERSKEEMLALYDNKLNKINLESAKEIATPQIEKLKKLLNQGVTQSTQSDNDAR